MSLPRKTARRAATPASTPANTVLTSIEAAGAADADAIAGLLKQAGLPHEDFGEHLAHFFVARRGEQVVGAVGLEPHPPHALLRSLVVAPAARNAGLGTALLRAASRSAQLHDVDCLYVLTTTAAEFFLRAGFERCDRAQVPSPIAGTREFRELCPASAVCLRITPTKLAR